jgi:predicted RNA methylase
MTTTDFENWIENNVEDIEDAFCLRQCVLNNEPYGSYEISSRDGKKFIKAFDETLMIASVKAEETFLNILEDRFADEGLDIDSTYEFKRQMEKDD